MRPTSDAAIDAFNNGAVDLYSAVNTYDCQIPNAATHLQAMAKADALIAKIKDPTEKAEFTTWAKDMRAYIDALGGVPEIGDWKVAKAKYTAALAFPAFEIPDDLSSDDVLEKVIATAGDYRARLAVISKIEGQLNNKLQNCNSYFGNNGDKIRQAQTKLGDMGTAIFKVSERMTADLFEPLIHNISQLAEVDVTSYDGHLKWVRTAFDVVDASRKVLAAEKRVLALTAYTGIDTQMSGDRDISPKAGLAQSKKAIAEIQPLLAKRLAEVGIPNIKSAKDGARDKVLKGFITAPDKIAYGPIYYAKNDKESYEETDSKTNLRTKVVRLVGAAWVVVKPGTWRHATPDGVDAANLCELQSYTFYKYSKSGPGHQKNTWLVNTENPDRYYGPIMCSNAKVVSKLK